MDGQTQHTETVPARHEDAEKRSTYIQELLTASTSMKRMADGLNVVLTAFHRDSDGMLARLREHGSVYGEQILEFQILRDNMRNLSKKIDDLQLFDKKHADAVPFEQLRALHALALVFTRIDSV